MTLKQSDVPGLVYDVIAANLPEEIQADRFIIASGELPEDDTELPALILSHVPGPWAITTLGGDDSCRRRTRTGLIFIQVKTPANYGQDNLGFDIAGRIGELFEGRWQDRPLTYVVDIRKVGRDSAWFLANCVLTYQFEIVY